jgi:hypothetical protein
MGAASGGIGQCPGLMGRLTNYEMIPGYVEGRDCYEVIEAGHA